MCQEQMEALLLGKAAKGNLVNLDHWLLLKLRNKQHRELVNSGQ